jgi:hypothetical protein
MMLQMAHDHTATGVIRAGFNGRCIWMWKEVENLPHYYCTGILSSHKQRQMEDPFSGDKKETE